MSSYAALNTDVDSASSAAYWIGGDSSGTPQCRIATSIPYFTNQYMGIPTSIASNADSDNSTANTLTSWSMVETAGQYTKNPSYRIATSIPYPSGGPQGTGTAANADSITSSSSTTSTVGGASSWHDTHWSIATSIPYPDWSIWQQAWGSVTASNADIDRAATTSKCSGPYATNESNTGNYRIATSLPYINKSDKAYHSATAVNADSDITSTAQWNFTSGGSGTDYYYRIATSIPYVTNDNTARFKNGIPTTVAQNVDTDSTLSSNIYISGGTDSVAEYGYRIATVKS